MDPTATDSPFPGMDPYIERPSGWRGFHVAFLSNLMAELNARLPEPYTADIEESVQLVELDAPSLRETVPDGLVTRGPGPIGRPTGGSPVATLEPVFLSHPNVEEVKHRWVEIRVAPDRDLIAVIELLSPTNKGDGRNDYLSKRGAIMRQAVHLIEIDLLLTGKRLPMRELLPHGDYFAMVSRADNRPVAEVYAWTVRDRLPKLPVPLRSPDPDHRVDLQSVFAATYRAAAYDRKLDYAKPPAVRLPDASAEWVVQTARAGIRA